MFSSPSAAAWERATSTEPREPRSRKSLAENTDPALERRILATTFPITEFFDFGLPISLDVIADTSNHGAQQCYAGSQYYAFFTIPDGYYFSGFRVNLVNSVGTPQGTTPTSSFYVNVYTKTIDSNLTTVGTTKGYNTDNLGYTINSGYGAGWTISDPITIGAIHCFRNPWSSAYYNRGGWIQYTEISSGGGGSGSA